MRTPTVPAAFWRVTALCVAGCMLLAWSTLPAAAAARSSAKAASSDAKAAPASAPTLAPIPATTVYRCVGADGHVLYSQHRCEGATDMASMKVKDARTNAQAKQGHEIQQRADKLSREMQRVREGAERKPAQRHAMTLGGDVRVRDIGSSTVRASTEGKNKRTSSKSPTTDPKATKPRRPRAFTARVPSSRKRHSGSAE